MLTSRTKLSRLPKRGSHENEVIYPILDEAVFCHVSYSLDGQPFILPIAYCRIDDTIYIHGSVGSHFFRQLSEGVEVCVAVTLLDAMIMARSAFSHSVNYRSVVAFGKTRLVEDEAERWLALERITDHVFKGRWADCRLPNASEMKKTMVIAIPLEEASAKIRSGGVNDDLEDRELPYWAGVVPVSTVFGEPVADAGLEGQNAPDYLKR
ncbi:pyridoxamine 5'-phosphate oxidase family protein [Tellurirhabdus rosea]|uniref:pyridoxamine 5'-phosphate oxidase family protein n=1 Tax=Tellurirhabdus rosea TaxID=2674997 RepID=UPI002259DF7B|nr:pyridoxamine 5'-phosphate oxidase family protein [Tellurirhabdus rosea]